MPKFAFIFPGQGAQSVGMGRDFAEASESARHVFEVFNRFTSADLSQVCFEGPEDALRRTRYTQPAILATALAALTVFRERCALKPAYTAGHSLGEYGALYASGAISLEGAARLIQRRAQLMDAAPPGAMAAVLGLPEAQVDRALAEFPREEVTVANYNAADQAVISGAPQGVAQASERLKEAGAKRVIPLAVGGAFHSPLMDAAAAEFTAFLANESFVDTLIPVIANVDAQPTTRGEQFRDKLGRQVNHSVLWSRTTRALLGELGVDAIIEFGPGRVLTGMIRKTYPDVRVYNVYDMASLEETLSALNASAPVA
ncbi:MAG: ACP S-malonyltransferase [Vampirovibrionales bacterium]|nr:ACP S-malonyltransferase [Vampirovibrionales bacterium]